MYHSVLSLHLAVHALGQENRKQWRQKITVQSVIRLVDVITGCDAKYAMAGFIFSV